MKKNIVTLFLCALGMVMMPSCKPNEGMQLSPNAPPESLQRENDEPLPDFQTPFFPVIAYHLIYREFVKQNPTIVTIEQFNNSNYSAYLEQRLLTLYPEDAYQGIVTEAEYEYQTYAEEFAAYMESQGLQDTLEGTPEVNLPTRATETQLLNMNNTEIAVWDALEALTNNRLATRAEIDSLVTEGYSKTAAGPIDYLALIASPTAAAYGTWRILQSRARAEGLTTQYYSLSSGGYKGDAFRHIYVSMHLRRYISQLGANVVMTTYELVKQNACKDRYMDYHNNVIGRNTRYNTFRYSNNAGWNDWGQWAQNVKSFVDNGANAADMPWDNDTSTPPNCNTIAGQENNVSNTLLIHYK